MKELEKFKAEAVHSSAADDKTKQINSIKDNKEAKISGHQSSPDDQKPSKEEEVKAVEFEYTNANEMEELGSSNAFAEFMTIFQRFDEQVALKMDQAKIDTSMEALLPNSNQASHQLLQKDGTEVSISEGAVAASGALENGKNGGGTKNSDKKKPEVKMTKK